TLARQMQLTHHKCVTQQALTQGIFIGYKKSKEVLLQTTHANKAI
ncbi:MAG: hypothetical protein ACI81A_001416, partial [Paraglaciecola sp.]